MWLWTSDDLKGIYLQIIKKIFPFIEWFKEYQFSSFKIDFIAGLTVALVLIPQSMAYAQLAGLPAYYGLYAAFLPPMIAALFGSSRQLATGPVAVVSLMTAASLEPGMIFKCMYPRNLCFLRRSSTVANIWLIVMSGEPVTPDERNRPPTRFACRICINRFANFSGSNVQRGRSRLLLKGQ